MPPNNEFDHELIKIRKYLLATAKNHYNKLDVEDLVQQTLLKAYSARDAFACPVGAVYVDAFRAWIFTIMRNEALSRLRRGWRETLSPDMTEYRGRTSWAESYEIVEARQVIRLLLERLPENMRHALIEVGYMGKSYEEAARDLNCAVGTVKSRVARARKMLKRELKRIPDRVAEPVIPKVPAPKIPRPFLPPARPQTLALPPKVELKKPVLPPDLVLKGFKFDLLTTRSIVTVSGEVVRAMTFRLQGA